MNRFGTPLVRLASRRRSLVRLITIQTGIVAILILSCAAQASARICYPTVFLNTLPRHDMCYNSASMSTSAVPKLFQPITVGDSPLAHRVVMAPLTRNRADANHVHTDLGVEYYSQRASVPGTLLISEGTIIAPRAGGLRHVPFIESDAQIQAWKKITDAVHAKGSFIYVQLWALGRSSKPEVVAEEGQDYIGAGSIPKSDGPAPRPLTIPEIKEYVQLYATAAANAVHKAGFDGIELHGANGYLLDQFLQDVTNDRTDEYGGSIENRSRFGLEVIDAVVKAIGQEKTAIRLSPFGTFGEMGMKDPKPTFSYFASRIGELYPRFAYIHVVEAVNREQNSTDFLREIWSPKPFIANMGYTRDTAIATVEQKDGLIAFGSSFISNPDLPLRLLKDLPLTKADPAFFYPPLEPRGYIDYPFAVEVKA